MNSKKKLAINIAIMVLTTVLLSVLVLAVFSIFAATRQTISSTINVNYVSEEVSGEATARWLVANTEWKNMTTTGEEGGDTILRFGDNEQAALNPTDKNIKLSSRNQYVVFEYKFTNNASNSYVIDLKYEDTGTKDGNMMVYTKITTEPIESNYTEEITEAYGDWSITTIEGGEEKYVYILAEVQSLREVATYSGVFNFALDGKIYDELLGFEAGAITEVKTDNSVIRVPETINDQPVTKISATAFANNKNITELTIPDSVETIEQGALNGCSNLKYLQLPFVGGQKNIDAYLEVREDEDGSSYYQDLIVNGNSLDLYDSSTRANNRKLLFTDKTYSIIMFGYIFAKNGVADMNAVENAWGWDPTGNVYVDVPKNLNVNILGGKIYPWSFLGQLVDGNYNVVLGEGCTEISYEAFESNLGLNKITISNSVQLIRDESFANCDGLTSVYIPDGVVTIGQSGFDNCYNLTNVYFGHDSQLTTIGYWAFEYCENLTSFIMPKNVQRYGGGLFEGCSNLSSIKVDEANAVFTSRDGSGKECNAIMGKTSKILYTGFNTTTIPSDGTVETIQEYAFGGCYKLTSIVVPNAITEIEAYAFNACPLQSISLPFVGGNANAYEITDDSSHFCYIFSDDGYYECCDYFVGFTYDMDYYIPCTLTEVTLTGGTLLSENLDYNDGITKLTISGSAEMVEGDYRNMVCLTDLTIGGETQTIGEQAFDGLGDLTNLTISGEVQTICTNAFDGCGNLTNVTFGKDSKLTTIGDWAFWGCSSLASIVIPSSVQTIEEYAFEECTSLNSVTIESKAIYNEATSDSPDMAGGLLENLVTGGTVRVPTNIVNQGSNKYLNGSMFSQSIDGNYTVFTKR